MEKFQKYCLSVILVIIYSNISAQITPDTTENISCRTLCELYNKLLSEGVDNSVVFSNFEKENNHCLLKQRKKAIDVFGKGNSEIQSQYSAEFPSAYFAFDKYDKALENFKKQCKQTNFEKNINFKSKVVKIRNKDYLDLKEGFNKLQFV